MIVVNLLGHLWDIRVTGLLLTEHFCTEGPSGGLYGQEAMIICQKKGLIVKEI